jgi:hypothetical protein
MIMTQRLLLGLHGVMFRTAERLEVGPIHLQVHRGEKILLRCDSEAIYAALLEVLSGRQQPIAGRLDELEPVRVQTDRHLRESITLNRTIRELLEEGGLPDTIWVGQRRRSLFGVIDRLGLSPRNFRLPIKMESAAVIEKFWALRFIASRADLLVGREIFALEDSAIRELLCQCWGDLSAAVIYAGPPERIPGPPDTVLTLEGGGAARVEPGATSHAAEEPGHHSAEEARPPARQTGEG